MEQKGVNISTGETGIVNWESSDSFISWQIGLNASVQEVELLSITVTDSSLNTENPEPTTGETEAKSPFCFRDTERHKNSKCNDAGRKSWTDVYCTLSRNK